MKIVINKCHGGFFLSKKAVMRYAELSGLKIYPYTNKNHGFVEYYKVPKEEFDKIKRENPKAYSVLSSLIFIESSIKRNDPLLIQVVEELGENANGEFAELKIVEIPNDIEWDIQEYDGAEIIVEKHRSWC